MPVRVSFSTYSGAVFCGRFNWFIRFETSRDVDHLDNAERNAEAARLYLPLCFQELSLIGLQNMYWSVSAKQASNEGRYCNEP